MARARTTLVYDDGMQAALAAAGGRSALARRLGVKPQLVTWRTCPRDRLFAVARASGLDPETIRPDLKDWIERERARKRQALAVSRFSIVGKRATSPRQPAVGNEIAPPPGAEDLVSWGVAVAAMRFAAGERGLQLVSVWGGGSAAAKSAKAYAMALAHVAARISSTALAQAFGTSRQNIENAGLRYQRARDGDHPDDTEEGGLHVIERGRLRQAKAATDGLWEAERRFLAEVFPEERRRA